MPSPDRHIFQQQLKKHQQSYKKPEKDKPESPFDHFDPQVHKRMSESELVKKLQGVSGKQRVDIIAELVKHSFLDNYSKEDLKNKLSNLNDSIGLVPKSLKFVYKFIPREGRDAYLDKCVEYFIDEGIINGKNEYQKLWVKGRVLYGIASACGINMSAKA